MLNQSEIEYVDNFFGIYDHDWRFFSEFLGEPFIVDNCLSYFDGTIFYFCAFPVGNPKKYVSVEGLQSEIEKLPFSSRIKGLNLWGRLLGSTHSFGLFDREFCMVSHADESEVTDMFLELDKFEFSTCSSARLARNSAKNKGIVTTVQKIERLSYQHILLIEMFFQSHRISLTHAAFYLTVSATVKLPTVFSVEARQSGRLMGFLLLSHINEYTASLLMGFFDNRSRSNASDGVYSHAIEWAKSQGINFLHFGYSGTKSLLSYKKKWGNFIMLPPFSEIFFSNDEEIITSFKEGGFPWRDRIYSRIIKQG